MIDSVGRIQTANCEFILNFRNVEIMFMFRMNILFGFSNTLNTNLINIIFGQKFMLTRFMFFFLLLKAYYITILSREILGKKFRK